MCLIISILISTFHSKMIFFVFVWNQCYPSLYRIYTIFQQQLLGYTLKTTQRYLSNAERQMVTNKEHRHYWDMHLLYYKLKSFTYWQIHSHPAYEVTNEKSFQEANLHVPKNASTQVLVFRQIVFWEIVSSIYIKHSNFQW